MTGSRAKRLSQNHADIFPRPEHTAGGARFGAGPEKTTLMLGDGILGLRNAEETDLPLLASLRNDVAVQQLLGAVPRPNSRRKILAWLDRYETEPDRLLFVIALEETDQPVGFLQVVGLDTVHGTGELGICLERTFRGRGYAVCALALLERYLRDVFGLRKLVLHVLASNARAVACYDRAGYRHVGVHRLHWYQNGAYHDVLVMEKLLL